MDHPRPGGDRGAGISAFSARHFETNLGRELEAIIAVFRGKGYDRALIQHSLENEHLARFEGLIQGPRSQKLPERWSTRPVLTFFQSLITMGADIDNDLIERKDFG